MYNVNDFSTEFLSRQTGDKLSGLKLSLLNPTEMIDTILKTAGIISLTRLMRILEDGCAVAHLQTPSVQDVVVCLSKKAYALQKGHVYIARGSLMYSAQRLQALWQYLIKRLVAGVVDLQSAMEET